MAVIPGNAWLLCWDRPVTRADLIDTRDMKEPEKNHHFITHEPKFCRCRVCHEHFYGDTIAEARIACVEHGKEAHPDWGTSACYCPD
ncbi:MAG: hypothetical protein LJE91_13960 [Gammaproteobacteria bacterium]|nr:hypothetical protein [Gammaproteobacteria bacterium]